MKRAMNMERALVPTLATRIMVTVAGCVVLGYLAVHAGVFELFAQLSDPDVLSSVIATAGPLAVVVLLALAVVVSPIPSGPIAMAAGALYGPAPGGMLTAIGALLGAMMAFGLARGLGYRPLSTSNLPLADWITRPRTQASLAFAVFVSRLIPFISFDAVSYIAGLTAIRTISFAVATTLGILPASFAFAALGAGMATMDNSALMLAACGVTLVLPVGWILVTRLRPRHQVSGSNT